MAEFIVAPLSKPIKRGDVELHEVTLTEPTMASLSGLQIQLIINGQTDQLMVLLPRISDLTKDEIMNLSFSQIASLAVHVNHFLAR